MMRILGYVIDMLGRLLRNRVTKMDLHEIRNDLYDIKVVTGMVQPPPSYWTGGRDLTGDSQHSKPP